MNHTEKISEFLELTRIAVTGVSSGQPDAANIIFRKFIDAGYQTFPVNQFPAKCFENAYEIGQLDSKYRNQKRIVRVDRQQRADDTESQ